MIIIFLPIFLILFFLILFAILINFWFLNASLFLCSPLDLFVFIIFLFLFQLVFICLQSLFTIHRCNIFSIVALIIIFNTRYFFPLAFLFFPYILIPFHWTVTIIIVFLFLLLFLFILFHLEWFNFFKHTRSFGIKNRISFFLEEYLTLFLLSCSSKLNAISSPCLSLIQWKISILFLRLINSTKKFSQMNTENLLIIWLFPANFFN